MQAIANEATATASVNDVRLVGRLSRPATERQLPDGALLVAFTVVVDRPSTPHTGPTPAVRPQTVDSLDCVAWTAATRRIALGLATGDIIEVTGSLRRRFWRTGAMSASRFEVEAVTVRHLQSIRTDPED